MKEKYIDASYKNDKDARKDAIKTLKNSDKSIIISLIGDEMRTQTVNVNTPEFYTIMIELMSRSFYFFEKNIKNKDGIKKEIIKSIEKA